MNLDSEYGREFGVRTLHTPYAYSYYYEVLRISASYAAATEWTIAGQEIDICHFHLTVAG